MGTSTAFRGRTRYDLDADQIRVWYAEGASIREISRRLGVSFKTAQRHMVAAGIPRREPGGGNRNPVSDEEAAAIRSAFETGAVTQDIARQFGRCLTTVKQHRAPGTDGRRHPELDAKVRELHAQGLRGEQIDDALGWKRGRAYNYQVRLGLDPRRPLPAAAQVAELYRELGSVAAVARRLRRPERLISSVLRNAGITMKRAGRLEAHLDDIRRALLEDGEPMAAVAARYGVPRNTMQSFTYGHGVSFYRQVTAEQHDQMVQLRAAGVPAAQIARQLGVSGSAVYMHLSRMKS